MVVRFLILLLALCSATANAQSITAVFEAASGDFLRNPHDLRLSPDGRHLLVSDVGNNQVTILDPDTLERVGAFGVDHQSGTHDVDFDAQGRVYVADTHNNRVTIYEMDGLQATLVGELGERIRGPEGVLAHPNSRIYVAGAWSGNVVAYQQGRVVKVLGGLSAPHDLTLLENGDLWLSDSGNHRILRVSPELEIKQELGQRQYDFDGVRYMDLMDDGTLIAADKNNHQVKFISSSGELLLVLGSGEPGRGPNLFRTPEGVEVDGDRLWLSDSGNNRVVRYRLQQQ